MTTVETLDKSVTCDRCGKVYTIGEWPHCPHGIPGGMLGEFHPYVDWNLQHEPVEIRSLADRNRIMKANKLEHRSPPMGRKGCEF